MWKKDDFYKPSSKEELVRYLREAYPTDKEGFPIRWEKWQFKKLYGVYCSLRRKQQEQKTDPRQLEFDFMKGMPRGLVRN